MNKNLCAMKPPMGWNSWNCYGASVNEEQLMGNAEYMAKHLKQYGWDYIVCDIQWSEPTADSFYYHYFAPLCMDEYSRLIPAVERFPSSAGGKGFKPIADYIHSLGLKFGIHIMRGIPRQAAHSNTKIMCEGVTARDIAKPTSVCLWNPDMYGLETHKKGAQEYYDSLLELYAEWGVDFIKCDDICRMDAKSSKAEIEMLHKAIEKCGRDIVLSLSPGPALVEEHDFYRENANMWRITDDFWDHWESLRDMFDRCGNWQEYVTDGGYPDCDMLPLGMLGKGFGNERSTYFSLDEQKTMMTLWCIFRSPLMLGAELTKLDAKTMELLTKEPIYRMMKETKNAREAYRDDTFIIWKTEAENNKYTAVFNISSEIQPAPMHLIDKSFEDATEIWSGESLCQVKECEIPAHGVILLCK